MKQIFWIIVVVLICFNGDLFSAKPPAPINETYTYQIDHRNNEVKILQGSGTLIKGPWDLEKESHWEISKNTKIKIIISNPNPFYFNYKLGEVKKEELESLKELDEFLKELDNVYAEFEKLKTAKISQIPGVAALSLSTSIQRENEVIESKIENVIKSIRDNLSIAKDYAKDIPTKIIGTLNATPKQITALIDEVNGITKPVNMSEIVHIDSIEEKIKAAYEEIDKYQLNFIEDLGKNPDALISNYLQHQLLITSILKNQELRIKKLLEILVTFKENCNKLVGNILLYELTYDEKNRQIVPIQISYINEKEYKTDAPGVQFSNGEPLVGDIKFVFTPCQLFVFKFSVNGIYSSIKEKSGGDEKSRIIDIPALTIIPERLLKSEKINFGFQIGATVKSDTINSIVGLGIVFTKRFFFGGGLHIQIPKSENAKVGYYFSIGVLIN